MAIHLMILRLVDRHFSLLRIVAFLLGGLVAVCGRAALIDFETTPAGLTPTDDTALPVGTPYSFPGLQIYFGFDSNSDGLVDHPAVFEHAGLDASEPPNGGFSSWDAGLFYTDTADPGYTSQLGHWFLRSPVGGSNFGNLIINYVTGLTVTAASGEIWDIDGTGTPTNPGYTEEYTVRAYDSVGNLLATQVSPLGTLQSPLAPLDGKPWTFAFSGLTAGISQITIDFTGTKPSGIGLAFNNFNPTAAPEPASALLVAMATVAMAAQRGRRSERSA
jgi:hypothetical protein